MSVTLIVYSLCSYRHISGTVLLFVLLLYIFSVNDDTEMLSPGWTEVYINALQVRRHICSCKLIVLLLFQYFWLSVTKVMVLPEFTCMGVWEKFSRSFHGTLYEYGHYYVN